jgi:diadenylate cyclase
MYWRSLLESFSGVGFSDMLDITIVSCLIYFILRWFQQTKAVFVAIGIFIFTLVYLVARHTHMYVTTWIFQGFFAVFVLALVIIFQEELRSFFERLAVWSLRRRRGRAVAHLQPEHVEVLVQSLGHFAREQIGALIVLKGQDPLERHVDGGVDLDGEVSSPLLNSLFDPHSLGHDGAIVIERNRLVRFGSHLPLSKEFQKLTGLGTRHAAALGLSERTDALCIVVSEEKGIISIARNANIVPVQDLPSLEAHISAFLHETSDATSTRSPRRGVAKFFSRHLRRSIVVCLCAGVSSSQCDDSRAGCGT